MLYSVVHDNKMTDYCLFFMAHSINCCNLVQPNGGVSFPLTSPLLHIARLHRHFGPIAPGVA